MPKDGMSASEWRARLRKYSRGDFVFKRGQKPRGDSRWSRELAGIEKCPKHKATSATDVFGKELVCRYGYHDPLPPPSRPGSAGSSGVGGSHAPSSSLRLRFASMRCDVAPVLPSGPRQRRPSQSPSPRPEDLGGPRIGRERPPTRSRSPSRDVDVQPALVVGSETASPPAPGTAVSRGLSASAGGSMEVQPALVVGSEAVPPPAPFSLGPPPSSRPSRKRSVDVQPALVVGSEAVPPPAPGTVVSRGPSASAGGSMEVQPALVVGSEAVPPPAPGIAVSRGPSASAGRSVEVQPALVVGSEAVPPPAPVTIISTEWSSAPPEAKRPCPNPSLSTSLREEASIIATSK